MRALILVAFAVWTSCFVQAQAGTQLASFQCDPLSCYEELYTQTGSVDVDIYGTCYNSNVISAHGSVDAYNCLINVELEAWADPGSFEMYDECTGVYLVDYVEARAAAFHSPGEPYWEMSSIQDCEGAESINLPPPAAC